MQIKRAAIAVVLGGTLCGSGCDSDKKNPSGLNTDGGADAGVSTNGDAGSSLSDGGEQPLDAAGTDASSQAGEDADTPDADAGHPAPVCSAAAAPDLSGLSLQLVAKGLSSL